MSGSETQYGVKRCPDGRWSERAVWLVFVFSAVSQSCGTPPVSLVEERPQDAATVDARPVVDAGERVNDFAQIAYLKASNTNSEDNFGRALALSADGTVMVIGAARESSAATGVNGVQNDNTATESGAAYVFVRAGSGWRQSAYLKASNTDILDDFGSAVTISGRGDTIAIGAHAEDSAAIGVDGDGGDNARGDSGAVYVFVYDEYGWRQQAYLKASNTGGAFGRNVSLSHTGDRLAIAAPTEDSGATGVDGDQNDLGALSSGAVYVFDRSDGKWQQTAYLKASNTGAGDQFGRAVSLSADGTVIAVGAYGEDSTATGVNGIQSDNRAPRSGAAYVFRYEMNEWKDDAYIKASNTDPDDVFGSRLALSADGVTLAVSAFQESSETIGVNGDQGDNNAPRSGAVYVFYRASGVWSQHAYVKASNAEANDNFGGSLAISGAGDVLVVGAGLESSRTDGIHGDESDNSLPASGAAYIFQRSGQDWSQVAYMKASNPDEEDRFGYGVALAADGGTLSVGAFRESSRATGVDGDQDDNSRIYSGAVYVFH